MRLEKVSSRTDLELIDELKRRWPNVSIILWDGVGYRVEGFKGAGEYSNPEEDHTCPDCKGTGGKNAIACSKCMGHGRLDW